MNQFDLIVIGGGAAGLMACASAIRSGKQVLLLEKNNKLGVKILMSGGTRCNITHDCDRNGIVEAFGKQGRFLHSALASLPPKEVIQMIESAGVATKSEPGGKIFPVSNRAIDVRDALVHLANDPTTTVGGTTILKGVACRSVTKRDDVFQVVGNEESFTAPSVLITTGGKSYPGCGTTGDGYAWANSFGHKIVQPVAALTPITNHNIWSNALKGITFENASVSIHQIQSDRKAKILDNAEGGFLFTHFGFSGPTVLNVSRAVSKSNSPNELVMRCDFQPSLNPDQFRQHLRELLNTKPKQTISNVLATERWPRRFVDGLLNHLQMDPNTKAAEFSKSNLNRLVAGVKQAEFEIEGVYGFKKAEVTAGGVSLDEVDSRTMESKLCPGLFFAGEVLDLDGPIGGYNFQSAFSTGWLAGQSC